MSEKPILRHPWAVLAASRALSCGSLLACAAFLATSVAAADGAARTGAEIVNEVCASCHKHGENGAPRIGDRSAWAKRKAQGLTTLSQHAADGLRAMPAHGGSADLSRADLERAIIYMVNQSGADWIEPVNKGKTRVRGRTGEEVVTAKCAQCHQDGKDGAPKIGDRDAWVGRISKGLEKVIASGIHGRGAMPPRGGLADLSDAEMRAAVVYMFNQSVATKKKD